MLRHENMITSIPTNDDQDFCGVRCIHKDRIKTANQYALPASENEEMAVLFKAMGDPGRLKILWALKEGEMCVCDLAALLAGSESAVSHQLRLLRQMSLVRNRRQGQVLYYRLNDDHIHTLIHIALEHIRE